MAKLNCRLLLRFEECDIYCRVIYGALVLIFGQFYSFHFEINTMNGAGPIVKKMDGDEMLSMLPAETPLAAGYSGGQGGYGGQSQQSQQAQPAQYPTAMPAVAGGASAYNYQVVGPHRGTSTGGTTPMMYAGSSTTMGGDYMGAVTPGGHSTSVYGRQFSMSQQGGGLLAAGGNTARSTASGSRVISERVIEHSVRVPKRVTREDIIEKVVVVPERVVHEEVVEDVQTVREKIVEIAVPVVSERIVEVPEIEYVERIVEVPEVVVREKIREVPKVEIRERIVEVPKIYTQERIVEVPDIEYREVPVEKIIEIPEIREQVVIKEVPVPQYVDKPVPEYVDVHEEQEIVRRIPVSVEAVTTCEFKLPRLRPHYTMVDIPLYVPRFVEVAVPQDVMHPAAIAQADEHIQKFNQISAQPGVSLSEVEALARDIRAANYDELLMTNLPKDKQDQIAANLVVENWMSGRLQIDPSSMACATTAQKPDLFKVGEQLTAASVMATESTSLGETQIENCGSTAEAEPPVLLHVMAMLRDGTPVVGGVSNPSVV